MAFLNMKISHNKWINFLAISSFGVYLIHDHENFRKAIWKVVGERQFDDWRIIPYSLGIVIIIYFVCAAIELVRIYSLERIYMRLFDKFFDWLDKQFKSVYRKISDFIFSSDK